MKFGTGQLISCNSVVAPSHVVSPVVGVSRRQWFKFEHYPPGSWQTAFPHRLWRAQWPKKLAGGPLCLSLVTKQTFARWIQKPAEIYDKFIENKKFCAHHVLLIGWLVDRFVDWLIYWLYEGRVFLVIYVFRWWSACSAWPSHKSGDRLRLFYEVGVHLLNW